MHYVHQPRCQNPNTDTQEEPSCLSVGGRSQARGYKGSGLSAETNSSPSGDSTETTPAQLSAPSLSIAGLRPSEEPGLLVALSLQG